MIAWGLGLAHDNIAETSVHICLRPIVLYLIPQASFSWRDSQLLSSNMYVYNFQREINRVYMGKGLVEIRGMEIYEPRVERRHVIALSAYLWRMKNT